MGQCVTEKMRIIRKSKFYLSVAALRNKIALCGLIGIFLLPNVVLGVIPTSDSWPTSQTTTTQPPDIQTPILITRIVEYNSSTLMEQRSRFLEAEKALSLKQLSKFRALLPTLTNYPLYPYLRYQELKQRLHKVSPDEMSQFLREYESLSVSDLLRKKWLRLKARQGHWQQFLDFYTPQQNTRLQCNYLNALIRTGQAEAAYPEIEKLWLTGDFQPRICDRIFKHWKAAGQQSTELIWKRLELALKANHRPLARYLVNSLPNEDQKLAKLWIKLHHKPELLSQYQNRIVASEHSMAPYLVDNIIKRVARKSPQAAADLWFSISAKMSVDTEKQYAMLQTLAIAQARKQLPGAEDWFSVIPDRYLTDVAREWRVRSALRQSQWAMALTALNALTPIQQSDDRWQYWRARVNEELNETETALAYFKSLAQRRSYYGFLAADRLGLPYELTGQVQQTRAGVLFELSQQPGMLRAHEFLRLNRMTYARREWREATLSLSNSERVDAAKLAQHWGWSGQSILTMASTDQRDDIALRFPLLHQEQVLSHSEFAEINPAWTYGVIRRESAFVQDARSSKGALGLMQLMPATAKSISRSLPKRYRGKPQLTQADANLAFGTHYLSKMLKRFDGQTVLATAAYNAGARRITGWLPTNEALDADRWIETIPIKETRDYVTSVLAFTIIYADRLGIEQPRLSESMSAITPLKAL